MTLALIILIPFLAALLCLFSKSRRAWEAINIGSFAAVALLAAVAGLRVAQNGTLTAMGGFLRADSLSAVVTCVTAFVALVCSIYAVGYFRRDLQLNLITEAQLRHYYVLTPVFVCAMLLAPLADNLGVMWVAI